MRNKFSAEIAVQCSGPGLLGSTSYGRKKVRRMHNSNMLFIIQDYYFSKLTQVSMYPKDLVYPPGGEEVQLEMIRARWKQYCPMFELTEEENGSCDMEMTEAFPVNITLNVPLITSIERGRKVLVMKEKAKETIHELSEGTELPVLNEKELDHELELLCKENSTRTMVKKKTEEDKVIFNILSNSVCENVLCLGLRENFGWLYIHTHLVYSVVLV